MDEEKILRTLKDSLDTLKNDIATKEGARNATLERIKKTFSVESVEEAYQKLEKEGKEIQEKRKTRLDLLQIAKEKLEKYNLLKK